MRPIRWLRRGAILLSLGAAGTAVALTARHLLETPQPLENELPGPIQIDHQHGGNLSYSVSGDAQAAPLVLLHDFYPGASCYEFRHVFPRFATEYRVYAPDWFGFGMSAHPNVAYNGEFYANLLDGFLRDVVGRPATVIAQGRAANIAVRTASDTPDLVAALVLVSPYALAGIELEPTLRQVATRAAQRASLSLLPYALLSTRPLLRRMHDARTARVEDEATVAAATEHLYRNAHQFGGQHAVTALLTGALDLPMQNALALLEPPVLIVSGADDPEHPREEMEDLAILNPHADMEILGGAGEAVCEDQPAAFAEITIAWLRSGRERHALDDGTLLSSLVHGAAMPMLERETPEPETLEEAMDLIELEEALDPIEAGAADEDAPTAAPEMPEMIDTIVGFEVIDSPSEPPVPPASPAARAVAEDIPAVPVRTPREAAGGGDAPHAQTNPRDSGGREASSTEGRRPTPRAGGSPTARPQTRAEGPAARPPSPRNGPPRAPGTRGGQPPEKRRPGGRPGSGRGNDRPHGGPKHER